MKIAICDDNKEFIFILEKYIEDLQNPDIDYDVFYSGEDLVLAYEQGAANYDVIFLDMEMGKLNGLETATIIHRIDKHVLIVFVTSHRKYALKSFECSPFRFLVKPVKFKKFKEIYKQICYKLDYEAETLIFIEKGDKTRVSCEDIVYFQSKGHDILAYKTDGNYHKIRKSMGELMIALKGSAFAQTHRSYVVNLKHVFRFGVNYVTMNHSEKLIPISDTYRDDFDYKFVSYRERKYVL